jgi:membrane protein implicated in regulation of membrane protease activity
LETPVIVLGLILLIVGYILPLPILTTIGLILLIVGALLWVLGAAGRPVAGRRYWW